MTSMSQMAGRSGLGGEAAGASAMGSNVPLMTFDQMSLPTSLSSRDHCNDVL